METDELDPDQRVAVIEREICAELGIRAVGLAEPKDFCLSTRLEKATTAADFGVPDLVAWETGTFGFSGALRRVQAHRATVLDELLPLMKRTEDPEHRLNLLGVAISIALLHQPGSRDHAAAYNRALEAAGHAQLLLYLKGTHQPDELQYLAARLATELNWASFAPTLGSPTNYMRSLLGGAPIPAVDWESIQGAVEEAVIDAGRRLAVGVLRIVELPPRVARTVYDSQNRVVSTWIGTSDTPASGWWSPTNNTGPNNVQLMTQLTANLYDADSNLIQTITYPGPTATSGVMATPRITQNCYDWRNELVATKEGVLTDGTPNGTTFVVDDTSAEENDGVSRPITYYTYDNLGETTGTYVFDGSGVAITSTDGVPNQPDGSRLRSQTLSYYDTRGQLYQTSQYSVNQSTGAVAPLADAATTNTFYDPDGNVIESVDPMGNATQFIYDGAGRKTEEIDANPEDGSASGPTTFYTYDDDGNVLTVKDPNGNVTTSAYDAIGRLTSVAQPVPGVSESAPVTYYTYDVAGNLASVEDPDGNTTDYTYDALGRKLAVTLPDPDGPGLEPAPVISYTYDGDNHVVSEDDAGETTSYQYDIFGNVVQTTMPAPGGSVTTPVTSATYDNVGEVLTLIDAMSQVTTYGYNVLGQQTLVVSPNPGGGATTPSTTTTYDALGAY